MAKRPRRLWKCESVWHYGWWCQRKGFRVGEQRSFGGVDPVHGASSLHYKEMRNGQVLYAPDNQGTLAFDINYYGGGRWKTEAEALRWLYKRTHAWARKRGIPLDEMFFDGLGFIKERGFSHNHPIGGHDGHLHVGFFKERW